MQTSAISFQKDFSMLPGLQAAHSLMYELLTFVSDEGTLYGIQVIEETGDAATACDAIGPFTQSIVRAKQILEYLYENAVPAVHCVSVISDVCTALEEMNGEDVNGTKTDSGIDRGRQS